MLLSQQCVAQLCQGSLGDPIVNIDFGAGNNPGGPVAAATSGFYYQTADCPDDGYYTLRNKTYQCFGDTWHSFNGDHTADTNGYFMLVNASLQPSAFYLDTVKGLCGNVTFEFAAWIMNVLLPTACGANSNLPNITFTIEKTDGTILQTYNSGNIPVTNTPEWKQYGFYFTTPPGVADIVLRMVNNSPGGCGNDLALDDITFRPCGPRIIPTVGGQNSNTINICRGANKSYTFDCNVSGGFLNPVFQWQGRFNGAGWTNIAGANSSSFTANFSLANPAGIYEYRLNVAEAGNQSSPQCAISSVPFKVIINDNPLASAGNSGPVCAGSRITLTAGGGNSYLWTGPNNFSDSNATISINNAQISYSGVYTALVITNASCSSSVSTIVTVNPTPVAGTSFSDTTICANQTLQFNATGSNTFLWSPSAGLSGTVIPNPVATPLQTIGYSVIVSNAFSCSDTAYVNVKVYKKAIANAGPDKFTIIGVPVSLSGSIAQEYLRFFWLPSGDLKNTGTLNPQASPLTNTQYILEVESKNGCGVTRDSVWIRVLKNIFIPNSFTPNADGLNDTWNIPALNAYPDFKLTVYNRYGQIVFYNSYPHKPWDGSFKGNLLSVGTYVYLLSFNAGRQVLKGTVMMIR